jgi:protein TonB
MFTQAVAVALTTAILWTLHVENNRAKPRARVEGPGIQLSLEQAPAPEPPKPEPERPKPPQKPVQRRVAQLAVPMPAAPAPVVTEPEPIAEDSVAAVVPAAEPPPTPAGGASHASIEAAYAAALRKIVDERTTVPTSVEYQLMRPSGATQIRFVLDRLGSPSEVAIARSSGSHMLDRQALNIVAAGRYPPFPQTAFPGEARHVFLVTIEFRS